MNKYKKPTIVFLLKMFSGGNRKMKFFKKTMIMLDEKNYLVYINHNLIKEKGTMYTKEKMYLKRFVEKLWELRRENPDSLNDAQKIETIKEIFELPDLEII